MITGEHRRAEEWIRVMPLFYLISVTSDTSFNPIYESLSITTLHKYVRLHLNFITQLKVAGYLKIFQRIIE